MRVGRNNKRIVLLALMIITMIFAYIPASGESVCAEEAGGFSLKLASDVTAFEEGDPVYVIATGDPDGTKKAWVGLYKKDEGIHPGHGGVNSLRWFWLSTHEGLETDITADSFKDARNEAIRPGEYKVVLFGDEDYDNVITQLEFTVIGRNGSDVEPSDELSLELVDAKESYLEDEPIYVRATGAAPGAWVAVYRKTERIDPEQGGVFAYRWFYTADHNGEKVNIISDTFDLSGRGDLLAGNYKIVLFGDSGYTNIVKTIPIVIVENPDNDHVKPSDGLSLQLVEPNKTLYKIDESVLVKATGNTEGSMRSWVGLYKDGDLIDSGIGGILPLRRFCTEEHNGEKLNILDPKFQGARTEPITNGTYRIILFGDVGYSKITDQIEITIWGADDTASAQYDLETDKTDYMFGDSIQVKARGTGIDGKAWVALYESNSNSASGAHLLFWYYVNDFDGVFTTIQNRSVGNKEVSALEAGSYTIVLYADDSFEFPIQSRAITVTQREENTEKPQTQVDQVVQMIESLPETITAEAASAVLQAREAYDSLPDEQKQKIPTDVQRKLTEAEIDLVAILANTSTDETGNRQISTIVTYMITSISDQVNLDNATTIAAVRTAYDLLTDAQKKLVPMDVLKKLTDAEKTIDNLQKQTQSVIGLIKALPQPATAAAADAVKAARAAYDALAADQKSRIPADVLKKLTDAEAAIASGSGGTEPGQTDQAAADKAADAAANQINALPEVITAVDAAAVAAARAAYDGLTDAQKALVPAETLNKLVGAETVITQITKAKAKKVKLVSVKNKKSKKAVVKWKKLSGVNGYQVQYSTNKKFKKKGLKKKDIKKAKIKTVTLKKLKKGKTYYVRVCSVTKVKNPANGKITVVYGKWSKANKVKIKK